MSVARALPGLSASKGNMRFGTYYLLLVFVVAKELEPQGPENARTRHLEHAGFGALFAACTHSATAVGICAGIVDKALTGLKSLFGWTNSVEEDDVILTMTTGDRANAGGTALEVSWWTALGETQDELSGIGRGETNTWQQDLTSILTAVELRIDERNDLCVKNVVFVAGSQVSGTGLKRYLELPAGVMAHVTNQTLDPDCVWFGASHLALGNFKFEWKECSTMDLKTLKDNEIFIPIYLNR